MGAAHFPRAGVVSLSPGDLFLAAVRGAGRRQLHFTGHPSGDLPTSLMQWTPNDILSLLIFPPPPPSHLQEMHHGKLDQASTSAAPRAGLWEIPDAPGTRQAALWARIDGVGASEAQIAQRRHKQGGLSCSDALGRVRRGPKLERGTKSLIMQTIRSALRSSNGGG